MLCLTVLPPLLPLPMFQVVVRKGNAAKLSCALTAHNCLLFLWFRWCERSTRGVSSWRSWSGRGVSSSSTCIRQGFACADFVANVYNRLPVLDELPRTWHVCCLAVVFTVEVVQKHWCIKWTVPFMMTDCASGKKVCDLSHRA